MRIAVALVAVAAVVALNQTSSDRPAVLGTKLTRCSVEEPGGGVRIPAGVREVRAQRLSVEMRDGAPGAVLAPPLKISPGVREAAVAASVELGVKTAGKGRISVVTVVRNLSTCPVAVSGVRVQASRGAGTVTQTPLDFGGRDRVVIQPGRWVSGRVVLPAQPDGAWAVDATATADVGASA